MVVSKDRNTNLPRAARGDDDRVTCLPKKYAEADHPSDRSCTMHAHHSDDDRLPLDLMMISPPRYSLGSASHFIIRSAKLHFHLCPRSDSGVVSALPSNLTSIARKNKNEILRSKRIPSFVSISYPIRIGPLPTDPHHQTLSVISSPQGAYSVVSPTDPCAAMRCSGESYLCLQPCPEYCTRIEKPSSPPPPIRCEASGRIHASPNESDASANG